uniref:Glycosyltransferase n=1 Tax=Nymphaea colorata TaxID=210225 RepID=A0A5K0YBU0_9MAGN|nr:unnamed protein product [Nymphaea colorata]
MAETPRMIIFPFMAQGHALPLLDLAKMLSYQGIKITIFTTPANSNFILHNLSQTPNVELEVLEFPHSQDLPPHCENTHQLPSMDLFLPFLLATKRLQQPFDLSLQKMVDSGDVAAAAAVRPLCIISDFFLPWTLDSASKFDIPRLVFQGMSAYASSVLRALASLQPLTNALLDSEVFEVPGLPTKVLLTKAEMPKISTDPDLDCSGPLPELIYECYRAELQSHGAILNTFLELEPLYVAHVLSCYYRQGWCLGPLFLFDEVAEGRRGAESPHVRSTCSSWLDGHADRPGSVIYASFGTQAPVSDSQQTEIACGLEASGCPFVLVVRSKTWLAPEGLEERLAGRGLVLREWTPQWLILSHPAVGGFLTHCGWNSVLESLSAGVPMLTWPIIADQTANQKMVVDELGAGILTVAPIERVRVGVVERETVRGRVVELMLGEEGRRARARAMEIGCAAKRAVGPSGSSRTSLRSMIGHLRRWPELPYNSDGNERAV